MSEPGSKFSLEKPARLSLSFSWWLTVAGTVAAAITLLYPDAAALNWIDRILLACAAFVALPILLASVHFAYRMARYQIRRALIFDDLYADWAQVNARMQKAQETIQSLYKSLGIGQIIEIRCVKYYRNRVYVSLIQNSSMLLDEGQPLVVIDVSDGLPMGRFRVCELLNGECLAVEDGELDPVWLGYIRSIGGPEMSPPPSSVAVLVSKESQYDV